MQVLGIQVHLFAFHNRYVGASAQPKTKGVKYRFCEEVSMPNFHCELVNVVIMLGYNKETKNTNSTSQVIINRKKI